MSASEMRLAEEAEYLFHAFFRGPIPRDIAARYASANEQCFPECAAGDVAFITRMRDHRLDVEAIEWALRRRRRGELLTKKIQILFYLAEVRSEFYPKFVNRQPGIIRAALMLSGCLMRNAFCYLKGEFLIRRHGLI